MATTETRQELISALLQAQETLDAEEPARRAGVASTATLPVLEALVAEELVVAGRLATASASRTYRWWAAWARATERDAQQARQALWAVTEPLAGPPAQGVDVDDPAAVALSSFVVDRYTPPADKRLLVVLQCSVRRPFSSSPSHAFMRRAIAVATGHDPALDFLRCPVHVVVLASRIGPVPYELQDVYPANVSGTGVKQFSDEQFSRTSPVLVGRMSRYLATHRNRYDHLLAFCDGRYADVMAAVSQEIGREVCILPRRAGIRIASEKGSEPRTYWQKYWVQLHYELVERLEDRRQEAAAMRLEAAGVELA